MDDIYYIIGTAYAGKSTMVKLLAEKYDGIACEENYHDKLVDDRLDKDVFPCLCYTRDLQDWREFIRRSPQEYASLELTLISISLKLAIAASGSGSCSSS